MMDYNAVLATVLAMLQQEKRLSYRVLKLRLQLDDDTLEALKEDLIYAKKLAVDEEGRVLVWAGSADRPVAPLPSSFQPAPALQPAIPEAALPQPASPPAAPVTPEAERRQLTVMFCDLVDSTALASQLDPEDLREVIRAYQATGAAVIQRYGGHIAQYLRDGLLVYFGYPQAHEDDAQRAVRTGLEMVEALRILNTRLDAQHGLRLAVRLGIHTGVVVVGEMGGGGRQEQLALGETPNLAARLQGLAAPDTVVISAATLRLVQGYFTAESLGAHALKGVAAPVPVYRILGESGAQSRLDAVAPTRLTPLVGREEEVALVQRRWDQATTGLGQVVLLSGEAGIGKSRLVQVLKEHVTAAPHTRIEWRGSPYHRQSAFYPIIDHLHRLLRWRHDAPPAETLRTLEAALAAPGLALVALAQLPERRDTLEQAIDVRLDLYIALQRLGEEVRIFDNLRAAEALAERLGDDQRLGRIASRLGAHFSAMGEHDRAIASAQRALVLATTSGAFDVQVLAQTNLGQAYYTGGDFRQALDVARRAMALLTGDLRSAHFGRVTVYAVNSRCYVAGCLGELEGFAEGRGLAEEAVQIAETIEQPFSIAAALLCVGLLARRHGDLHQTIPALERSLSLCHTANFPRLFPMAASFLSAAYALAGRAAEARPLLDQTLERVAAGRRVIFHALVLIELSEALLLVGRVDEARTLAGRLLELYGTHTGHGYQAYAYRLLGGTAVRGDPPEAAQAATHYRQALALAEALGMRPLQAHCHLGLGTLYAKMGQPEQACTELSAAIALFQSMAMTFWLPQAEAALAQVR